jgi:hypothetical protein
MLNITINLKDTNKSFNIDNICNLVEKFYSQDFIEHEKKKKKNLIFQLQHYEPDFPNHSNIQIYVQYLNYIWD